MTWRGKGVIAAILVAILTFITIQQQTIRGLRDERDKYKGNTETLLSDVETFRVRDSLNAARVQALELTKKEYERFRAEDAALIRELKARNRDLAAVNKTQTQTIIELRDTPRDTVIIRDSVKIPAMLLHCGDEWYDFDGLLSNNEFTGILVNRDSLLVAETVKYRRFLGFLWKTKRIENRELECLSKNPHTQIVGMEHVVIEK